ncbi:MAG: hypothetical protein NTZ48_04900 [Candidatus Omnitrophica bacterium]|nr:hypothetical protein [Candidatus Omnitrophota bacterium]
MSTSRETCNLIKQGAKPITLVEDVFKELNLDIALLVAENKKLACVLVLEEKEKAV